MNIKDLAARAENTIQHNSPAILTGAGVGGVLTTAYLAAKAGYRAARRLDAEDERLPLKDRARIVWKDFIPTAASTGLTISCIVMGARASNKRAAAAYSLLTVSEKAFSEYREKVTEVIGKNKEQKVKDAVVQDRVTNNPPPPVVMGTGDVLCREGHTGRYFMSNMETLKKAENQINHMMIRRGEADLDDFYKLIGLETTSSATSVGWKDNTPFELVFTSSIAGDGRPCLTFDYNYLRPL